MSRSRKKNGIIKDKGFRRSEYNRAFRRVNRQRIRLGQEPKVMNEVVCQYSVCDYIFRWSENSFYWFTMENETDDAYRNGRRLYFGK